MSNVVENSLNVLKARIGDFKPKVALVLGTGLGHFADELDDIVATVPYEDMEGFPRSTVVGHSGQLVFGTLGGVPMVCMQGRVHMYEGHSPTDIAIPVRVLHGLGIEALFLTNASGSIRAEMGPGSLMMIEDHINFSSQNPLVGENDDSIGPRFPDMTVAYDKGLRDILVKSADEAGVTLHKGVYVMVLGPCFETPAEIHMFRTIGADVVGMSTVPEVIVARHAGLKCAAVSVVTNLASGLSDDVLSHEEALEAGEGAVGDLTNLVKTFLSNL